MGVLGKPFREKLWMVGLTLALVDGRAIAQDQCKDVLADGVRSTISLSSTSSQASNTADWFCSESFLTYLSTRSAGFSLKVPIDGVPVEFKGTSDNRDAMTQRNNYCGRSTKQFSQQNAISVWRQVADPSIVQAWVDCMSHKGNVGSVAQGVQLSLADVGGGIVVAVGKFQPAFTGQPAPSIYSFDVTGLKCTKDRMKSGAELTFEGLAETCTRSGDAEAVAILLTDQGYNTTKLRPALDGKEAGKATVSVAGLGARLASMAVSADQTAGQQTLSDQDRVFSNHSSIFELLYRRFVVRLGHAQAIGAIAHGLCRLVWKILHDGVTYEERGPAVIKARAQRRAAKVIRELHSLCYRVELTPAPSNSAS
jgi:hypothetical protein